MIPPLTHPPIPGIIPDFGINLTHQRLTSDFAQFQSRRNQIFSGLIWQNCNRVLNRAEIDELQLELAGRNDKIQGLVELCAELRTSAKLAGWLTITALVVTSLGGIAISLAGSPVGIPNEVKQPMAYGGGVAGICGLVMTLLSNSMIRSTSRPTAPDKTVNQLPTVKTKSTPN